MSILSLLFVLMFLLFLALDYKRLSRFVVLVIDHITLIHVVDLFLVVGINYCVTELLLFPSIISRLKKFSLKVQTGQEQYVLHTRLPQPTARVSV
jgi:hypothetical protein